MNATEGPMRVGGLTLHVRDVGSGPPLLLINGLGAHTAMWAPVERRLPGMRLISFDAPGIGDSPRVWPPPSIPMLADRITLLLDQLGLDRVDVLGYSFGGAVAQELAGRHPDRVHRLVLVATTLGRGALVGDFKSVAHICNPIRYYSRRYYERSIGDLAGGQARWDEDFRRRHGAERRAKRPHPLPYYHQIGALTAWSSLPWLDRVATPTLVVSGDDDPLVPLANSMLIASRLRKARLFVAPGEGHLLLFDDNGVVHDPIREFLLAPTLAESTTWQEATRVDEEMAEAAIAERGMRPLPWGPINAVLRHRLSPPGSPS
ncbi:MAG: alpha/beta hydrolase [Nocardioides sp.]|uniref:alpha/beta fold hydrolase n=1 Tax=Nocardioides sp. TaxID=35761 RepID=UPI0039E3A916